MTPKARSALFAFVVAGISLVITVATGVEWLGKPFRLVQLVTIVGLGMFTGVWWMQAVSRVGQENDSRPRAPVA